MTVISRHIEKLLLNHNCVIIPKLGGFVAHYVPSILQSDDNQFLPPCRSIGFNPRLYINDGLLVQSYMQANKTNYVDTVKELESDIEKIRQSLQKEGVFDFGSIGKLYLGLDGNYDFRPSSFGIVTPRYYGLSSYSLTRIEDEEEEEKKTSSGQHYTLRINKEIANYVAAAMITLIFYWTWAIPGMRSSSGEINQAAVVQQVLPDSKPQSVETDASTKIVNEEKISEKVVPSKAQAGQQTASLAGKFTIVLATAIPKGNVDKFISDLAGNGVEGAQVVYTKNYLQIVVGAFVSEKAAWEEMLKVRKIPLCKDAWVSKMP